MTADALNTTAPRDTLQRLRAALRQGNWSQVDQLTVRDGSSTLAAHPLLTQADPRQRDAILRIVQPKEAEERDALSRAWSSVASEVISVKRRSDHEVEAIERITSHATSASFELSTRLTLEEQSWRVVETCSVLPDQLVVWLPRKTALDPATLSSDRFNTGFKARWKQVATLEHLANNAVVISTTQGDIRGTLVGTSKGLAQQAPELAEHQSILSLTFELTDDLDARLNRMTLLLCVIDTLLFQDCLGVAIPDQMRFMDITEFKERLGPALRDEEGLANFWISSYVERQTVKSAGMRYFSLPELEVPVSSEASAEEKANEELWRLVQYLIDRGPILRIGDTCNLYDDRRHRIVAGALGPRPGVSYGREGSIRLEPA